MKTPTRIFLQVHTPAPGAAPEEITVKLSAPHVVFGAHPAADRNAINNAINNAHRLLGGRTYGFRAETGDAVLRLQAGFEWLRPRHAFPLFFFTNV